MYGKDTVHTNTIVPLTVFTVHIILFIFHEPFPSVVKIKRRLKKLKDLIWELKINILILCITLLIYEFGIPSTMENVVGTQNVDTILILFTNLTPIQTPSLE